MSPSPEATATAGPNPLAPLPPAPPPSAADLLPDAVVFVPGMGSEWTDQSLGGIATQACTAFGRLFPDLRFRAQPDEPQRRVRILAAPLHATDPAAERRVLDVYDLNYHRMLVDAFESRTLFVRCLLVFVATASSGPRLVAAQFRRRGLGKSRGEWLQLLYFALILSMSWAYLALLCAALYQVVQPTLAPLWEQATAAPDLAAAGDWLRGTWAGRGWAWLMGTRVTSLAVVVTFAGMLLKPGLKDKFLSMMTNYYCAYHYLSYGDGRRLVGLLEERLRPIANGGQHRSVHVCAYSFGSILAFDALFPNGSPRLSVFDRVGTLVTIGSPVDLVRTFWPRYLTNRVAGAAPPKWLNVFSLADVLASNLANNRNPSRTPDPEVLAAVFRPDPRAPQPAGGSSGAAPATLNLPMPSEADSRDFTFMEVLALAGLVAHAGYWDVAEPRAISCFDLIFRELYAGDPRLALPA